MWYNLGTVKEGAVRMKISKSTLSLAKKVWAGREEGRHGWKKHYSRFITIEPMRDECGDYLLVTLTNKVDDLGYCFGNVFDTEILDREDFGG